MTLVLIFMYAFMLPRFAELFAGLTHELPVTTRILLRSATVLKSSWLWLIPIPVLAGIAVSRLWRTARMRRFRDELKLGLPVVRRLYEEAYLFQLFLSLGLLLGSHVPHLEAIEIARDTVGNLRYRRFFGRLRENVEAGRGMAHAFAEAAFIPEAVKLMVTTGEQAGTLDTVMVRLSERFREDLESDIRRLGSLLEPLMLVVMGIAVGTIATSLIIPIFRLSRTVH
jgi:type II secretory pathway component PulF